MNDRRPDYAELHRHLDGSLRPETLAELLAEQALDLPPSYRFYPGMGIDEALACFALTLSVLQDPAAVARVAAEICEDAEKEGVSALEIRFAPQLHQGAALEAIVEAAIDGVRGRAGIILCGLYGEPPEVLERLVTTASSRSGVVGIDLAGAPLPGHKVTMVDYAPAFQRARNLGLGRTVHAGEGRSVREIRVAIEQLGAQRIGHGVTLLDDPEVLELVVSEQVTIEACPSSNLHTGCIAAIEEHPLPRWLALGVRATVCTDNTLFSAVTMPQEQAVVAQMPGMNGELLQRAQSYGHEALFPRR